MDGYVEILLDCEAIVLLAGFVVGATTRWSFTRIILGSLGLGLLGVVLIPALGAGIELVQLAAMTAVVLLPFILLAVLAGRAAKRLFKRIF